MIRIYLHREKELESVCNNEKNNEVEKLDVIGIFIRISNILASDDE